MVQDTADSGPRFTVKQGQYLAYINAYTLINSCPPAESDMQRFFRVTGPAVHGMMVTLERNGLITRQPRVARSILLVIDPSALPMLERAHDGPIYIGTAHHWSR